MSKKIRDFVREEARAAEEAELTADPKAPLPHGTTVTRGHGRSRVLQVRLNEDEFAMIEKLSTEQHIPASTLARSILLQRLQG